MAVQYEIDGDVFREITVNWLCADVKEFLIKARRIDTSQTGETIEYVQLNDGRIFTRLIPHAQPMSAPKTSTPHFWNRRMPIHDQSITQPR